MKLSNNNLNIKKSDAKSFSFGFVKSLWNENITNNLYSGAYTTLLKYGAEPNNIITKDVPGSFELIYGAKELFTINKPDAIIVIGSIIKGETPHFDFISQSVANGIKDLNILFDIPFIFCVLTDLNIKQAQDRSGGIHGNKGSDSALTAIHLLNN